MCWSTVQTNGVLLVFFGGQTAQSTNTLPRDDFETVPWEGRALALMLMCRCINDVIGFKLTGRIVESLQESLDGDKKELVSLVSRCVASTCGCC